jgi:hypothetical protein
VNLIALKAYHASHWYSGEQGYMQVRHWVDDLVIDSQVAKKWLKKRCPDLYNAIYPKSEGAPPKERHADRET